MITTRTKVFFASSVVIAGLASKTGGSCEVLALAELGIVIPYISEDVLHEVFRNIHKKLPSSVGNYYALIKTLPFRTIQPTMEDIEHAASIINEKDAGILAAAMSAKVDWLLSMDKHFLKGDLTYQAPFAIDRPGDFLAAIQLRKFRTIDMKPE